MGPSSDASQRQPQGDDFLNVGSFPFSEIRSGGPSKDEIPALTDPVFVAPNHGAARYLNEDDTVLGLVVNGEARAYPHSIFWHHEIVNDVIGGLPVVVTYCPLTGTGMAFDGTGGAGSRFTAGVTGLLFNSNLILYDRRDGETIYPQMTSRGISGPRAGTDLRLLPVVETTWRCWKKLYPGTLVLGSDTGVYSVGTYLQYPYLLEGRDYRTDPDWLFESLFPRLRDNPLAARFGAKKMALGVRIGQTPKAYLFSNLAEEAVVNDVVGGSPLVVVWYGKERLAIPYSRNVNGRVLSFDRAASLDAAFPFLLKDRETGTIWNLRGEAVEGPLLIKGNRLAQIPAHNTFWFAWATFWRATNIY